MPPSQAFQRAFFKPQLPRKTFHKVSSPLWHGSLFLYAFFNILEHIFFKRLFWRVS